MVFNGKKVVFNDWYSMANTTTGVMAAILLFFTQQQTSFDRTVKTPHGRRKILTFAESVEKTHIDLIYKSCL